MTLKAPSLICQRITSEFDIKGFNVILPPIIIKLKTDKRPTIRSRPTSEVKLGLTIIRPNARRAINKIRSPTRTSVHLNCLVGFSEPLIEGDLNYLNYVHN